MPYKICHICDSESCSTNFHSLKIKNSLGETAHIVPICKPCVSKSGGKLAYISQEERIFIKNEHEKRKRNLATSMEAKPRLLNTLPYETIRCKAHKKLLLYALCNGKCSYCGKALNFDNATIDHVKPLSSFKEDEKKDGKTSLLSNLLLACQPCNFEKGNMTLEEYRKAKMKFPFEAAFERKIP